ncbi:MAG: SRPBCC family protein [Chitinophagaceae bacterium]|nr:SRPBCC family protein [Chitinophagaceae bacterium]
MNETNETRLHEGASSRQQEACGSETPNVSNAERALSLGLGVLLLLTGIKKIRKQPLQSLVRLGVGYGLLFRGASGVCPVYRKLEIDGTKADAINIRTQLIVNKPKQEVYAFWRKLENLPRFMRHISSIKLIDEKRSHWEANMPQANPILIKWDAEIVKDEPEHLLSWQSLPGSMIEHAGKVEFHDALGNRGTELKIALTYKPPAGNIGTGVSKLMNPIFERMIKEDLLNIKQFIEMRGMPIAEQFSR